MITLNSIIFLYLCGVLISGGIIYTLNSCGLFEYKDEDSCINVVAYVLTVLLSWFFVIMFLISFFKGVILALRGRSR